MQTWAVCFRPTQTCCLAKAADHQRSFCRLPFPGLLSCQTQLHRADHMQLCTFCSHAACVCPAHASTAPRICPLHDSQTCACMWTAADLKKLLMGHSTWDTYSSMVKLYKHFHWNLHLPGMLTGRITDTKPAQFRKTTTSRPHAVFIAHKQPDMQAQHVKTYCAQSFERQVK